MGQYKIHVARNRGWNPDHSAPFVEAHLALQRWVEGEYFADLAADYGSPRTLSSMGNSHRASG